jgi:hypothetical protein
VAGMRDTLAGAAGTLAADAVDAAAGGDGGS